MSGSRRPLRSGNVIALLVLVLAFTSPTVEGSATHYCLPGQEGTQNCTVGYGPDDFVAAIDRKDSEFRKGDRVLVTHGDESVTVTIVDTCGCPGRRVIDLTSGAFRKLAPLGEGVIDVTLRKAEAIRLPDTSTEVGRHTHL